MSDEPKRLRDAADTSPALRAMLRAATPEDPSDDARARVAARLARDVSAARDDARARETG